MTLGETQDSLVPPEIFPLSLTSACLLVLVLCACSFLWLETPRLGTPQSTLEYPFNPKKSFQFPQL